MKTHTLKQKKDKLISILKSYDSLMVAFSGGVDSMLLLAVAHEVLKDNLVAVTSNSPVHPGRETELAEKYAKELGVRHLIIDTGELELSEFIRNTPDRCYVCKQNMITRLGALAKELGVAHIAHGVNRDDLDDYRPGLKAADEMDVKAPLLEAGLTKRDIRELAREMGLPAWNAPSQACLATRLPYGSRIRVETLNRIGQAEDVILGLGFTTCRVRIHETCARIETAPDEIEKMLDRNVRGEILNRLRQIGFSHVSIDLEGYVQGSMNRDISIDFS